MAEWHRTTIGELVAAGVLTMSDGYRTKRAEHGRPGFRIIRVADIRDGSISLDSPDFVSVALRPQVGSKVGQAGDVLLTTKGTVGRVAVLPDLDEEVVYSPQVCFFRVRPDAPINPAYLRYWFSSEDFWRQARDRMNNTDMAAYINLADVRSLSLALPPTPVQRAIAEVLGALDDKIAANTRTSRALDSLTLALAAEVPQGSALRDIATVARSMVDPASLSNDVVDLYSLPGFDAGKLPEAVAPESIKSGKFKISSPAVLVSKLNPRIPRVWEVPACGANPALGSTEFVVLHPMGTSTAVLWALLAQPSFSASLEARVAGTSGSHQRVKPDEVLSTMTGDPAALGEGTRAEIDALRARSHAALSENVKLSATRGALLPALMSGSLRVKEAERLAEDLI